MLGAVAYHVMVNFSAHGGSVSAGWYLYAAAVPKLLLVVHGLAGLGVGMTGMTKGMTKPPGRFQPDRWP